jgi:hypothetical protein
MVEPPLIPLADVPSLAWLPRRRGSGRLAVATVWRWAVRGCRARDGALIRLHAVRVGNALATSEAWLRNFFAELTAHDPALASDNTVMPAIRTTAQRQRAAERAAKALEQRGI